MRDIPGEMTPENMQIVIDETRRLTSLVNDVLDLSRITSGTLALRNERFSLTELCGSAMERYAHLNERTDTTYALYIRRRCMYSPTARGCFRCFIIL